MRLYGIEEWGFAPLAEIKTYTLLPAACAACANSKFKPWSNLYWFSNPPAAPRVVPSEEKKIVGGGAREVTSLAH